MLVKLKRFKLITQRLFKESIIETSFFIKKKHYKTKI